jgi:hypothetical protein
MPNVRPGADAGRRAPLPNPEPPAQGWRTAQNARVPFVVLGRRLSPDSVRRGLAGLLEAKRAGRAPGPGDGNYHPSDRTFGISDGDARGADIAPAWARAAAGWGAAAAGGGSGGGSGGGEGAAAEA